MKRAMVFMADYPALPSDVDPVPRQSGRDEASRTALPVRPLQWNDLAALHVQPVYADEQLGAALRSL